MCRRLNIQIVNGRSYHPQTQGLVEQGNKVFKARLYAIRAVTGHHGFMRHLAEIALCMNTVRPESLPAGITPYEAWYGRPHIEWPERAAHIAAHGIDSDDSSTLDSSDLEEISIAEIDTDEEIFQLSALSKKIKENQQKVAD